MLEKDKLNSHLKKDAIEWYIDTMLEDDPEDIDEAILEEYDSLNEESFKDTINDGAFINIITSTLFGYGNYKNTQK